MQIVAVFNQKGGVGKTSGTMHLVAGLGRRGLRVLAVDFDPQSSLSNTLSVRRTRDLARTMYNVICDSQVRVHDCITETIFKNVDLLPMVLKLRGIENEVFRRDMDYMRPRLRQVDDLYDVCLIDCPPNLGKLAGMALTAADYYLVPVKSGDQFGLDGFEDLLTTVEEIKVEKNPDLKFLGAILMMHDGRKNMHKVIESAVAELVGKDGILDSKIPDAANVLACATLRKSIFDHEPSSVAGMAYARLVKEVMARMGLKGTLTEDAIGDAAYG